MMTIRKKNQTNRNGRLESTDCYYVNKSEYLKKKLEMYVKYALKVYMFTVHIFSRHFSRI